MGPYNQLVAAKALIDTPEKWTKGYLARDAEGRRAGVNSQGVVCFCMEGALIRAGGSRAAFGVLESVVREERRGGGYISSYNDSEKTTHADVMRVMDKAILRAGGKV